LEIPLGAKGVRFLQKARRRTIRQELEKASEVFDNLLRNMETKSRLLERAMLKICPLAILCAFTIAFAAPALAQAQPIRVGGLTCDTSARVGLVLGSRQNLRCVFRSNATGRQYAYTGTMKRLGLDVGITAGGRLFWGVFAPTSHIGQGTLRGNYVGASGNASLGLGLGANVLIGGSNRTISLQPLSVEGQIGINLAVGVARLTLR